MECGGQFLAMPRRGDEGWVEQAEELFLEDGHKQAHLYPKGWRARVTMVKFGNISCGKWRKN